MNQIKMKTVMALAVVAIFSISMMVMPSNSYGQIAALDKLNLDSNPSPQCLDFNQDKICESILLANGTMISNPLQAAQPMTGTTSRTAQTTNFLPYENPTLGIRIQHPVGWQLEEDGNKVTFVQQKDIVSLETNVDNNIDSSLSEYVNTRLQELREQRQNFNLIESTPTTISGNPAHKLVYTFLKEDGSRAGETNKVLRIWSIIDNKLYTLAYLSEADRYSEHLPEIEKTIDSFRINPITTPASTKSTDSNNDNRNNERNNDNNQKNWRDDPNCWYYDTFVCDKNGKCDSKNFDCVTDCDDGSSVTTGFPCPGEKDEGVPDGSDESGDNPRDDPDCWYGDLYVCDESGNCDTENFDCITDCEDGSSVTTGEECPGDDDSDEQADDEGSDGGDAEEEDAEEVYVDDVEDFEGGDSQETAEGEREYDEEGDSICGNDETGEEWTC